MSTKLQSSSPDPIHTETMTSVTNTTAPSKKPIFRSLTGEKTLRKLSISSPALKVDTAVVSEPIYHNPNASSSSLKRNSMTLSPSMLNLGTPSWSVSSYNLDNELRKNHVRVTIQETELIIPTLVHKCCSFISDREPVEGIFRINGALKKIKKIELKIKEQGVSDFEFSECNLSDVLKNDTMIEDVHANSYDAAMVLKRWLLDLENGLITTDVNEQLKREYKFNEPNGYSALSQLPIENIHLFIYLLHFLNNLSKDSIVEITKMTPSNISKIFQLSFFKTDDLTCSNPLVSANSFNNTVGSTDDLLENYKINEQILKAWIESYSLIYDSLKDAIISKKATIEDLLLQPITVKESQQPIEELRNPKLRNRSTSSEDKQSRRKSMFGYRTISNAMSSRALSQGSASVISTPAIEVVDRRVLSDTAASARPQSMMMQSSSTSTSEPTKLTRSKRKSFGWFNSNSSAPSLVSESTTNASKSKNTKTYGSLSTPTSTTTTSSGGYISRPLSYSVDDLRTKNISTDTLVYTSTRNVSGNSDLSLADAKLVTTADTELDGELNALADSTLTEEPDNNYMTSSCKAGSSPVVEFLPTYEQATKGDASVPKSYNGAKSHITSDVSGLSSAASPVTTAVAIPTSSVVNTPIQKKSNRLSKMFSVTFGLSKMAH
ncbi:hypothetical protein CANARDRAFT_27629 [[Candida] arabinofermentans NRRL YB-2248]|uniref:Rho-GAP domain-containing protein n=1 Tax=[Candida] arabinofermentans NRRL YB-2248 TaxID=983967 RepID=A0A1E4T3T3_9ASCO|nr:hypothetical protein CANARDRAFT_27629 [[Candida] arabinofermentans NRRL YB-2248]